MELKQRLSQQELRNGIARKSDDLPAKDVISTETSDLPLVTDEVSPETVTLSVEADASADPSSESDPSPESDPSATSAAEALTEQATAASEVVINEASVTGAVATGHVSTNNNSASNAATDKDAATDKNAATDKKVVEAGKGTFTPALPESYKSVEWVLSHPSTGYLIQLLGSYSEDTAIRFLQRNKRSGFFYVRSTYKGKEWFVVIDGVFASKSAALDRIKSYPKALQTQEPWVRSINGFK
jgi:septal ring-binding cell division protein DamX